MLAQSEESFKEIKNKQLAYFNSEETRSISFRKNALKKLKTAILREEANITNALKVDLNKSFEESYLTEISVVVQEIDFHLKNVAYWSRKKSVKTPFHLFPSKSYIQPEPLGVALIISPWNYPFQLAMNPLIGAISSGCCALVKVSPHASSTATIIEKIISCCFDSKYIAVLHGDKKEMQFILREKFDLIFFTGSTQVGRIVMKAAAENLTPVVLELGGKSPCIVVEGANLKLAAKRIIWSKTLNAGQTCIAPDFVLVQDSIKESLIEEMKNAIETLLGKDPSKNLHYGRIIHNDAFNRLTKLIDMERVRIGGIVDENTRYISPTVMELNSIDESIMKEEIFGPILPIIAFRGEEAMVELLKSMEKPLATYYFGNARKGQKIFERLSFGGGCINDGIIHIANHHLPFGGVGHSGQGRYHGKASFEVFSNFKGIASSSTYIDLPFRYPPYRFFKWIKKIL